LHVQHARLVVSVCVRRRPLLLPARAEAHPPLRAGLLSCRRELEDAWAASERAAGERAAAEARLAALAERAAADAAAASAASRRAEELEAERRALRAGVEAMREEVRRARED
jgi:hypothetical protein